MQNRKKRMIPVMKNLFWYPWIMAALVLGILICLGLIARMLTAQLPRAGFAEATLVKGAIAHALA